MSLIMWECKKIARRRTVQVALCFALGLALFSTIFTGVYNLGSRDSKTGVNHVDGVAVIARQYAWADTWKGPLTNEKLAKAMAQYGTAFLPEYEMTFSDGSVAPSDDAYNTYIAPLGSIPNFVQRTFALLPEYQDMRTLKNLPLSMVADYAAQRERIVEDFLVTQVPNADDRAVFTAQNAALQKPFVYDWFWGQQVYLELVSNFALVAAMSLCIALAPIFAGETQQKTDSVLLCTRFGRKKLARAKLFAAMGITAAVYWLCAGIYLIGQWVFVGTRALACPIQIIKPIATAPLTIGQAELYALILGFVCCLAVTAVTVALSAKFASPFPVIILALLFLFLPYTLAGSVPPFLDKILALLPFGSDYSEVFRTNLYHIFGMRIWSPILVLCVPIAMIVFCLPLAQHLYIKRQA
ncbi:MAG: hypothetical protein RR937_02055 [Ruthenibacterium sp.]